MIGTGFAPGAFFRNNRTQAMRAHPTAAATLLVWTCLAAPTAQAATIVSSDAEGAADWDVVCAGPESCTLSRTVINTESNERVATLAIEVAGDTQSLTVTTPLGVAVAPGVRMVMGDAVTDLPILVCLPTGCLSARALDDDELRRLAARDAVEFRFFGFRNERPFSVTMDLDGLHEVLTDKVTWRGDWP